MGGPTPGVAIQPSCPDGRSCHIRGKGIKDFAGKFSRAKVAEMASSSVLLMLKGSPPQPIASGTLVRDNVVLCAAHSIENQTATDLQILLFFECDAKTAPSGDRAQATTSTSQSVWKGCTKLRTKPQAKVVKAIEQGHSADLDYALLAIEWTEFKPGDVAGLKVVEVPRIFSIIAQPSKDNGGEHAILIAHPDHEPTQASVGKFFQRFGPHPDSGKGADYDYAGFTATTGSSGGGVFNEKGRLIGVFHGIKTGKGMAYLNLSRIAFHLPNSRIARWLDQTAVELLKPGDPQENVTFKEV